MWENLSGGTGVSWNNFFESNKKDDFESMEKSG